MAVKNNFLELVQSRTTVYQFSQKMPSDEILYQVLEAGRWAPSAGNIQPWHFILVRNADTIHRIIKELPYGEFHNEPPVLVALVLRFKVWSAAAPRFIKKLGRLSYPEAYLSMSLPAMNMLLAATDLDLGACLLTPPGKNLCEKLLGTDAGDRVVLMVGLGYEAEGAFAKKNPRKELDSILSYETFEGKKE